MNMYKNKKSGPGPPEIESSVFAVSHQTNTPFCGLPPISTMLRSPQMRSKKSLPSGKCKAGLLAHPCRNAFPVLRDQWPAWCGNVRDLQQRELLPTFTAFPFHHAEPHNRLHTQLYARHEPFVNLGCAKLENKFVSLQPLNQITRKS